jgi:hypothetical protein
MRERRKPSTVVLFPFIVMIVGGFWYSFSERPSVGIPAPSHLLTSKSDCKFSLDAGSWFSDYFAQRMQHSSKQLQDTTWGFEVELFGQGRNLPADLDMLDTEWKEEAAPEQMLHPADPRELSKPLLHGGWGKSTARTCKANPYKFQINDDLCSFAFEFKTSVYHLTDGCARQDMERNLKAIVASGPLYLDWRSVTHVHFRTSFNPVGLIKLAFAYEYAAEAWIHLDKGLRFIKDIHKELCTKRLPPPPQLQLPVWIFESMQKDSARKEFCSFFRASLDKMQLADTEGADRLMRALEIRLREFVATNTHPPFPRLLTVTETTIDGPLLATAIRDIASQTNRALAMNDTRWHPWVDGTRRATPISSKVCPGVYMCAVCATSS